MSIPNEEIVRKAVITTDALAAAGKLNPAQSDKFIDYVVDETVLKNNARVVRFRNESLEIEKIGVGKRLALPKAEAQDVALRRGVSTSKVTLTPRELIVPFEIGDNFKEINIEGDGVEEHIIRMMSTQTANDLEELYINGDKLGHAALESDLKDNGSSTKYIKDSYLALQDGWLKLARGAHVVDAEGANIGLATFGKMMRAMPTKFRRNKSALRWFMSPDLAQLYMEKLATRATALGDSAAGGSMQSPFGVPIVEVPLWDFTVKTTVHVTLTGVTAASLGFAPIENVVVTPPDLAGTPVTPYVEGAGNDYVVDYAAGTIARDAASTIPTGTVVKVTFDANPQMILTHQSNMIVGIGRDIRIEKDRDIYKGVNQYAITAKVAVEYEELDAIVFAKNIGQGV
jgi:hypothetical protein